MIGYVVLITLMYFFPTVVQVQHPHQEIEPSGIKSQTRPSPQSKSLNTERPNSESTQLSANLLDCRYRLHTPLRQLTAAVDPRVWTPLHELPLLEQANGHKNPVQVDSQ